MDHDKSFTPLSPTEALKTYSSWTGFAMCINLIIGTGVFNLPYAFHNAGLLLSIALLLICSVFSWFCLIWFLEVSARAEGIISCDEQNTEYPQHQITFRKFDLNSLCAIFYGTKGKIVSQLTLCLYCYGLLWAYASVFANSVNNLFWQFTANHDCTGNPSGNCSNGYLVCLCVYAGIVLPISLLNLSEQATVQVILTVYRFVAFTVMIFTVSIGLINPINPNIDGHAQNHLTFSALVNWSGFAGIFTTAAVALNFHFTLPDVIRPVKTKKFLRRMTSTALIVAATFYVLVAILCSLYFGPKIQPIVTLNWQNYTGSEGGWTSVSKRPWWAIFIQLVVMLFPVFDMLSVFPMIAVTLGDNILQFIPHKNIIQVIRPGSICCGNPKRDSKFTHTLCRLVSTIPPIICAAVAGELNEIFKFTGLFAFFLELLFPCLLQLGSCAYCEREWGKDSWKTMYSMHISRKPYVWITIIFGTGALLFSIFDFIVDLVPNQHIL